MYYQIIDITILVLIITKFNNESIPQYRQIHPRKSKKCKIFIFNQTGQILVTSEFK